MRKVVKQIEMNPNDVVNYLKLEYEANANSNLFVTALKNSNNAQITKDLMDSVYKKYIEAAVKLEECKNMVIYPIIPDEYRTDKYNWIVDIGRNCLEISEEV